MKKLCACWVTGFAVALFWNAAGATDLYKLPDRHPGARTISFSGRIDCGRSVRPATQSPEGHGFRDAIFRAAMVLNPAGIDDPVAINLWMVKNADWYSGGKTKVWGSMSTPSGGQMYYVGQGQRISPSLSRQTLEIGGSFWGGPLEGALILATETTDIVKNEDGEEVSRNCSLEGVLVVPAYAEPAILSGALASEIKPLEELVSGLPWTAHRVCSSLLEVERNDLGGIHKMSGACDTLPLGEVCLSVERHSLAGPDPSDTESDRGTASPYPAVIGGASKVTPINQTGLDCGKTAYTGAWGYVEGSPRLVCHMETAGAFSHGRFANCLYIESATWEFPDGDDRLDSAVSTGMLLVPEYVELTESQPSPHLMNFLVRGYGSHGTGALVAGFVINGSAPKTLLIRGLGPSLGVLGLREFMQDPELQIFRTVNGISTLIASNDDWRDDTFWQETNRAIVKTGVTPRRLDDREPALVITMLEPGTYTISLSERDSSVESGFGLIEVTEVEF